VCNFVGHVDMLNILIDGGADVNLSCAKSGLTALMLAASQVLPLNLVLLF